MVQPDAEAQTRPDRLPVLRDLEPDSPGPAQAYHYNRLIATASGR